MYNFQLNVSRFFCRTMYTQISVPQKQSINANNRLRFIYKTCMKNLPRRVINLIKKFLPKHSVAKMSKLNKTEGKLASRLTKQCVKINEIVESRIEIYLAHVFGICRKLLHFWSIHHKREWLELWVVSKKSNHQC